MSSDDDAAERLSHGRPVHEVLDISSAAAWTGLNIAVRNLVNYGQERVPVSGWRPRWGRAGEQPGAAWTGPPDEPRLALALCHPAAGSGKRR